MVIVVVPVTEVDLTRLPAMVNCKRSKPEKVLFGKPCSGWTRRTREALNVSVKINQKQSSLMERAVLILHVSLRALPWSRLPIDQIG